MQQIARVLNVAGTRKAFAGLLVSIAAASTIAGPSLLRAQNEVVSPTAAAASVPQLIRFSGVLTDGRGWPITTPVKVLFGIYSQPYGEGEPLWQETQQISPNDKGDYSVLLGSANPIGVPIQIFKPGESQYLSMKPEGEPELSRALLVSVPYALKPADSAMMGGLPASAFVLAGTNASATAAIVPVISPSATLTVNPSAQSATAVSITPVTTSDGTKGTIPMFTTSNNIENSTLYYNSTGLGIGRLPAGVLDVNGKAIIRGSLGLSRLGDATTSAGYPSNPFYLQSSVYNSSYKSTVLPYFQVQSEPTGNNTASTGARMNFLYYSGVGGAGPQETGLSFNPNGTIHFAPAQTFPITQGPQGPKGPAGPAGPKGPAGMLSFPYYGTGSFMPGTGSDAVVAHGGTSDVSINSAGGIGISARGGSAAGPLTYGGVGGYLEGGDSPSGGNPAGYGLQVYGGNGSEANYGGLGIVAYGGDNAEYAAFFGGDVYVSGSVSKAGGSFRIDDPEDPANKYLSHSFVESPDMMNIYNGNVVTMPTYFESLNRDFRYQLTTIGQPAQAYIAIEIANGVFTIKTDRPNVKVSWQVTGVRQDAWANAHRIPVEQDKAARDKGRFLHPELFGRPEDPNIEESHHPNLRRQKRAAPDDGQRQ